jgi:hypothetical protein
MIFATSMLLASASPALARRGYDNYSYTNNVGNSSSYVKQVAPLNDSASAKYPALGISYNYNLANSEDVAFADEIRVFLCIRDETVLKATDRIVAEVKLTAMNDYQTTHVQFVPLSIDRDAEGDLKPAYFDVTNEGGEKEVVKPSTVYRMFVNLHRESDDEGADSVIGRIPLPYYVATSGETRLELARQQIVMRTFKEFYYRKNGWRTGERYSMDCYAYYMWATGFCTTGAENGRTKLYKLFNGETPYNNGSQISTISMQAPIQGDYVRKPGHSFMLLSYDPAAKHVWCMEGNFNSTVEVTVRSVSSSWQVGHLRERHIVPNLFQKIRSRDKS